MGTGLLGESNERGLSSKTGRAKDGRCAARPRKLRVELVIKSSVAQTITSVSDRLGHCLPRYLRRPRCPPLWAVTLAYGSDDTVLY